jgi:hypothetical protein
MMFSGVAHVMVWSALLITKIPSVEALPASPAERETVKG